MMVLITDQAAALATQSLSEGSKYYLSGQSWHVRVVRSKYLGR